MNAYAPYREQNPNSPDAATRINIQNSIKMRFSGLFFIHRIQTISLKIRRDISKPEICVN